MIDRPTQHRASMIFCKFVADFQQICIICTCGRAPLSAYYAMVPCPGGLSEALGKGVAGNLELGDQEKIQRRVIKTAAVLLVLLNKILPPERHKLSLCLA